MNTDPGTNLTSMYIGLFLLQWIFNLGIAAWVYFSKADNKNAAATAALGKKLDGYVSKQNERMASLEATVRHLPTDEEITSLREDVASMKARVEGMDVLMKRMDHQVTMIHQHLLREK